MATGNMMARVAKLAGLLASPLPLPRSRGRRVTGDVLAGALAGVIVLSYCLSYSSLLFPGALVAERPSGLWALLVGSVIVGLVVSWRTSLPPVIAAPDTAAVVVLAGLGTTIAARIAENGGTPSEAVTHMLLCFVLAGGLSGLLLLLLGATGTASYIRFIPYPVAAGFIGATGLLMIVNSLIVILPNRLPITWATGLVESGLPPAPVTLKLSVAIATAILCILARWLVRSSLAVTAVFLMASVFVAGWLGSAHAPADAASWFNRAVEPAVPWNAFVAVLDARITWSVLTDSLPEVLAYAGVLIMSALIKTTNLEVARATSADLDTEFKAMGWANILSAGFGGIGGTTQTTPSRALTEMGGTTRLSGYVCALSVGIALFTQVDLVSMVPAPVLAGLLIFFGWTALMDMLGRPSAHLSWLDVALILLIIAVCARWGFEAGGLIGFALSCIIFVFRYRAIGVVRRHMTRRTIASIVSRPLHEENMLRAHADAVHLYWLSGYLFFGSSDSLFERIRADVEAQNAQPVRFLILDFSDVSGLDISALKSLAKLTAFCELRRIRIAYTGLSQRYRRVLESGRFITGGAALAFETRSDALEWAEEALLGEMRATGAGLPESTVEDWLRDGLGGLSPAELTPFLVRREVAAGTLLYAEGDDAGTIEFVASGLVAISITDSAGRRLRVRRMSRQTIVGEMGFFRNVPRRANVEIEEASVVYTMTRDAYRRMCRERPDVAARLLEFVIRTMADRLDFANREIGALT